MSLPAQYQNLIDLLESINDCLAKQRILPALTLLYTGIDVMGSLERRPTESVRDAFVRWSESYLLKGTELPCTAIDLFAARCGILHTFTAESDLLRKGEARRILYAWGTGEAKDLSHTVAILGRSDIALHVEDLVTAFRNAAADYLKDVAQHPERMHCLETQSSLWLSHLDKNIVEKFLESLEKKAPE